MKDGPIGSGRVTDLDLVLLHDRTPLSEFTCYLALAAALHPLLTTAGSGAAANPYGYLSRASHACHHADGSVSAKQAAAAHVVVDETLATCLSRLKRLHNTTFVLPPAPPSAPSPSMGPAVALTPPQAADSASNHQTSPPTRRPRNLDRVACRVSLLQEW